MKFRDNNNTKESVLVSRPFVITSLYHLADKFTASSEMNTSNILIIVSIPSKEIKKKNIPFSLPFILGRR
jgi:hypothetical protein